jgi:UDP-N-acetylglucosamine:LPS N-acetylglucosamine transferase
MQFTNTFEGLMEHFEPPVLIVSTVVGRGMYYLGEAIRERFSDASKIYHFPIEDYLPPLGLNEDVKRYKVISTRLPFLFYLIYKIPIFYYRKYLREKLSGNTDLSRLKAKIESLNIKTVICVSHRPAFWVSNLKRREKLPFKLCALLGEYGRTLGWKFIFWDEVDYFLSPVKKDILDYPFPRGLQFFKIDLPARKEFYELARIKGEKKNVLLVAGFWGQGPLFRILKLLSKELPQLKMRVVCGENVKMYEKIRTCFAGNPNIKAFGVVESLIPFFKECGSIITKPGIATIIEAYAAGRKIFLLKGMPVAEDNNAYYAINNFGADWFNIKRFKHWLDVENYSS